MAFSSDIRFLLYFETSSVKETTLVQSSTSPEIRSPTFCPSPDPSKYSTQAQESTTSLVKCVQFVFVGEWSDSRRDPEPVFLCLPDFHLDHFSFVNIFLLDDLLWYPDHYRTPNSFGSNNSPRH